MVPGVDSLLLFSSEYFHRTLWIVRLDPGYKFQFLFHPRGVARHQVAQGADILELTEALFADKDFGGRIEHRHSTAVFAIFGVGHVGDPEFERGLVPDIGDPTSVGIGADLLAAVLRLDAIVERYGPWTD